MVQQSSEQLLREFARGGSEETFRKIVERHVGLVYATPRRITGNAQLAEDVAQIVFRDLARKAGEVGQGQIVAGWLHRHTSFTASKMVRGERRRRERELLSAEEQPMHERTELAPLLEPALEKLRDDDRTALVLRFLEARELREVGATLGISEDAAQKRVSRALEKLRAILARGGMSISAAALSAALQAQVTAAPANLSKTILTAVAAASITPMTSHLILKFAGSSAAIIAVALGLTLQQQKIQRLSEELKQRAAEPPATLNPLQAEVEHLRRDNAELHKLRGDVTALRQRVRELEAAARAITIRVEPEAPLKPIQVQIAARYAEVPEPVIAELQSLGIPVPMDRNTAVVLTPEQSHALTEHLEKREGVDLLSAPKITTVDRREARIGVEDQVLIEGQSHPVGTVLNVLPEVSADRTMTSLKLDATCTEYLGISEQDQAPRFRVRQAQSFGAVQGGQSLLLQAMALPHEDGTPPAARKMLILVSPALINADGSPLAAR